MATPVAMRGLYGIFDVPGSGPLPAPLAIEAMIEGGANWIQLRAKGMTTRERVEIARPLAARCKHAGVGFVVNDDLHAAIASGASGLHLGQEDCQQDPTRAERARAAGLVVGVSTHDCKQFERAQRQAWGYVALGPVFATTSKANPEACVGLDRVAACAARARHPLVGIGGVTAARAKALWSLGVDAVAVISAIRGETVDQVRDRCRAFERPADLR